MNVLATIARHIETTLPCRCKAEGLRLLIDPVWVGEFEVVGSLDGPVLRLPLAAIDLNDPKSLDQIVDQLGNYLQVKDSP